MDKNAIKKYAVWARRELISRVSQKAALYEITTDGYGNQNADSVHGRIMSTEEKKQRIALIDRIKEKGYEQVMEEIAYTWFNRFSALRFMEVNGYLPTRIRVFTDEENHFKPQILTEAINMELDGLDMQTVYDLKNANNDDALFKYMIIVQCNALSKILPGMFQRISDYTEILLPDNLLREGSVLEQMIALIPQEDWKDQVEIIGWLYQYYIAEPKDELINARKQYKDEDIPYVTQLFTSDWIVRFMVENSLGRMWLEGHPNDDLRAAWKYYLDGAGQEPEIEALLSEIQKEYSALKPEDILAIDPCQGSGHILAYMFDVLVQIYEAYGYSAREAVFSIVKNNIWGLDIDERATQLAYFSVMMKARQYDRRFFNRGIQPNVFVIEESNHIDPLCIDYFVNNREDLKESINVVLDAMTDAKEVGSLISVQGANFDLLNKRFEEIRNEIEPGLLAYDAIHSLQPIVTVAQKLSKKYHIVITNPPYMSASYMPGTLKSYIQKEYSDFKNDLFSAFTRRVVEFTREGGQIGLLMPYVWMFISSYERMRDYINRSANITALVQLEYNAFEAACVPVASLTLKRCKTRYSGEYIKLSEFKGADSQAPKTLEAIQNPGCGYRYSSNQKDFRKIPGEPIAYWVGKKFIDSFEKGYSIDTISDFTGSQHITADNNRFLRYHWEVLRSTKWKQYAKGGEYRKWYGNILHVVRWDDLAINFYKNNKTSNMLDDKYVDREGITYTDISSFGTGFRYFAGGAFDKSGPEICISEKIYEMLALLNSKVVAYYLNMVNPTIHTQVKDIKTFPIIDVDDVEPKLLAEENVRLEKEDWDAFEVSYDFQRHPLIRNVSLVKEAFQEWSMECEERYKKLRENEEYLNKLYIDLYGLEKELTPDVEEELITVRNADIQREIRSLISYAVGCMFGRYSLDVSGLIYDGGTWDESKYASFCPDTDSIIPICDDEYFSDDVVGQFIKFIEVVYGKGTLEDNLRFIADALGGKGSSREVIRTYFLKEFYYDHIKTYQKRPIYWLFDSGKKNGFKCLIYIHRYQPDIIARIRTDYVHEQQSRYRTAIAELESRIASSGTSERVKLAKRLGNIRAQAEELRVYEEKIHHLADQMIKIDLDNGVKQNYALFQDVLAKVK